MEVSLSRLLALGIFSAYFLIIIGLFYRILANLLSQPKRNGPQIAVYTFAALALTSFAHTWYCELQINVYFAANFTT